MELELSHEKCGSFFRKFTLFIFYKVEYNNSQRLRRHIPYIVCMILYYTLYFVKKHVKWRFAANTDEFEKREILQELPKCVV